MLTEDAKKNSISITTSTAKKFKETVSEDNKKESKNGKKEKEDTSKRPSLG